MNKERLRRHGRFLACAAAVAVLGRPAAADEIVVFDHLGEEEVVSQVFRLSQPRTLHVVCQGAGDGAEDEMYAYGWILNLRSRDVVWSLTPGNSRSARNRNYTFDGEVSLPPGEYIAYYASYGDWRRRLKIIRFLGKEIGRIEIDDGRKKRSHRDSEHWGLRVESKQAGDRTIDTDLPPTDRDPRSIVEIVGVGDNELEQRGFTLPERMPITVYCIGEIDPDTGDKNDHGWILDAKSRKKVWELSKDNYKYAGGASMNKYARETITLPAGDYIVSYASDGGHSADDWKGPPPYDPDSWGITIWAQTPAAAARVRPYEEDVDAQSIVALVRQSNDSYVEQGLKVSKPMQVRVYALGEMAGKGFADCGWIEDFRTQRQIWRMTEENTQPAGGASKNRVADEVVSLPIGEYVIGYRTDDSHAYREWNATPPNDPSHWGITLSMVGRATDRSAFQLFDADRRREEGHNDLVRLVRVGDDANVSERFKLERPTRVRILAVGEGAGGEMYDYGWIEDGSNGSPVWEMTMRNTHHAGGAEKNRVFDGTVLLDRGEYEAHFTSDGSHSWNNWNAERPDDPALWGIVISPEAGAGGGR